MNMSGSLHCASDLRGYRPIARRMAPFCPKMITTKPPRRLEPSGGVTDCVGVDMTHATLACAKPTKKNPQGRTGTPAGYLAHLGVGEQPCEACKAAHGAKSAARKASLSPVFLERERKRAAEHARAQRAKTKACAISTVEHPEGCQGSTDGYLAHITAGESPCQPCRRASTAHKYEPACARPTPKHPNGRTGTRAGYHAHMYRQEPACPACLEGLAATVLQERAEDPDIQLRSALWSKYRLSLEGYKKLLHEQGGTCAICKSPSPADIRASRFHVDHDHACCPGDKSCGKCVRGLLCRGCNTALGNFGDDPDRLIAAAAYLMSRRLEVADA